jgi:hypothetical protein
MFNVETAMVERVDDLGWNKEYNKKFREGVREAEDTMNLLFCGPDQTQDIALNVIPPNILLLLALWL